ncbi:hypothetical protein Bsp3421_003403 [Burkholderia sp. FERM BP-3421]|uniref:hypothetical protein n=1 Tax=Burkholderia sp. FERM BP-3421 TaxID=1494466 RepID=UPI00235DCF9D|nr:hypothetical protein [Burkholderia sp. FERM BP-3421]WDD93328.1 hypothetical protein Bsp3421_003403 [Burkholderia sp. FERM BP-3421]
MLDGIRRFAHRLGFARRRVGQDRTPISSDLLDPAFDTNWHGDHWQNLLASPLDARHYVMEDWAQPAMPPSDDTDAAPPARRRRWYEQ